MTRQRALHAPSLRGCCRAPRAQLRAVKVYKLFVKDSVEQRIMALVAQRGAGGAAPEGSSAMDALRAAKGKQKILVSEIAGAIRDDKQALRLNELELLFSVRGPHCPARSRAHGCRATR